MVCFKQHFYTLLHLEGRCSSSSWFYIHLDELFTSIFLDSSSRWHFIKTKMRTKGQRSPTLLKPDAERYVDIVDLGQTQAVTVPDPPDCVTPEATAASRLTLPLPLNCSSFSSWTKHRLIVTPPALLAHARCTRIIQIYTRVQNRSSFKLTFVLKVTFWMFTSYCQSHRFILILSFHSSHVVLWCLWCQSKCHAFN